MDYDAHADRWRVRQIINGKRTTKRFSDEGMARAYLESIGGCGRRGGKVIDIETRLMRRRTVVDGCWIWQGRPSNAGYGQMGLKTPEGVKTKLVHRVSYEWFVAPIPDGLVIDHLCRNRLCFNPDHLEPVTTRENVMRSPIAVAAINARKTHCPAGHAYTPDNIYASRGRGRLCKTCQTSRNNVAAVTA